MKKAVLVLLFITMSVLGFSKIVNWVVSRVGSYSITSYDIKQMVSFKKVGGEQTATESEALEDLLYSYSILSLAQQNPDFKSQDREVSTMITSITNITNANDAMAQYKLKLYQDYPEQFKLQIERNQVMRALVFYDAELKDQVNQEPDPAELKKYFNKNKTKFAAAPELDLMVLAIEQPKNPSLDTLINLEEKTIPKISAYLKKTSDINKVFKRFKGVKFTSYSGRTQLKSIYDIIQTGMPQAVVAISLRPSITISGNKTLKIRNGTVVALPVAVMIPETKKNTYLIIKVIRKKQGGIQNFEKVSHEVKFRYKESRTMNLVRAYVVNKIKSGELTVDVIDKKYQGVYDGFLRR